MESKRIEVASAGVALKSVVGFDLNDTARVLHIYSVKYYDVMFLITLKCIGNAHVTFSAFFRIL